MEKELVDVLAQRAELSKALAEFPDDVLAAASAANKSVVRILQSPDPRVEPLPSLPIERAR